MFVTVLTDFSKAKNMYSAPDKHKKTQKLHITTVSSSIRMYINQKQPECHWNAHGMRCVRFVRKHIDLSTRC